LVVNDTDNLISETSNTYQKLLLHHLNL